MAKKRLIPKLLLKKGGFNKSQYVAVRTKRFSDSTQIGEIVSQAKIFQDQLADELVVLNIDPNLKFDELTKISNQIADEVFMPLTVGGGIDSLKKIEKLLHNGADKVSINTAAYFNPNIILESSTNFGKSTIVVSIDYKYDMLGDEIVYIKNGSHRTLMKVIDWVEKVENLGAGEIHLNSIEKDGKEEGLDLRLAKKIEKSTKLPIVISGGCGLSSHFSEGFLKTNVSGISAGTFFALKDQNFIQTRAQILNTGVSIREGK